MANSIKPNRNDLAKFLPDQRLIRAFEQLVDAHLDQLRAFIALKLPVPHLIDEIAHATKQDPLALRRKLMARHPKHLAVLNAVAERAGWASAPASLAKTRPRPRGASWSTTGGSSSR